MCGDPYLVSPLTLNLSCLTGRRPLIIELIVEVIVAMGGVCRRKRNSDKMKSFDLQTKQWKTVGCLPDIGWKQDWGEKVGLKDYSVVMSGE